MRLKLNSLALMGDIFKLSTFALHIVNLTVYIKNAHMYVEKCALLRCSETARCAVGQTNNEWNYEIYMSRIAVIV